MQGKAFNPVRGLICLALCLYFLYAQGLQLLFGQLGHEDYHIRSSAVGCLQDCLNRENREVILDALNQLPEGEPAPCVIDRIRELRETIAAL